MDQFEILGVVSTNFPRDVLQVAKVRLFIYFVLKVPRVLRVDGDEFLEIFFPSSHTVTDSSCQMGRD